MKSKREEVASRVLAAMNELVRTDCYSTSFAVLLNKVANLDCASRLQLITLCEEAFTAPALRKNEATRVGAAKTVVALLPQSGLTLKRWLSKRGPKWIYEIHFSLFCYLDEVQHFDRLKPATRLVLDLVASYLMNCRSDEAQACWMAADLLGDHWIIRESLPPLLSAAQRAKTPIAKIAAITGLSKALPRSSAQERIRIRSTLKWLAKNSRSRAVKLAAIAQLNEDADGNGG